ncbi:MAG TPA: hypothetical protein VHJ76_02820 [Actinomycetota bacterium]|nr:hypothetical protein [Actinomycetota bacterium]
MVPRRSTRAVAVIVALWVLACAAALALATTSDDEALAQGCRGGGSPSPSGSASPSPSESGGGFPPSLPISLPPGPDGDAKEKVPVPAPRPAPPRLDPREEVPVVTAQQQVTCRSTITIAYDEGRRDKFKGRVGSAEPMCKRARDVTVKKIKRGADQTVGKAVTNNKGRYSVPARNANGRFYAKVSKATVENDDGQTVSCQSARSRAIRP